MATTPYFGWPLPDGISPVQVPYWFQQGLTAVENTIKARPLAQVQMSASQSIPNSAYTAVQWATEHSDTDNMHSTVTNNSRFTINTAGVYLLTYHVTFSANATGSRFARWNVNGAAVSGVSIGLANASINAQMGMTMMLRLNAGDYAELTVFQSSGAALNLTVGGGYENTASVVWLASL